MEIPEYLKTKISEALLEAGFSTCAENMAVIFNDYDKNHSPHYNSVKYFSDVLLPITTEEKLQLAYLALDKFIAIKNDLYDEYANDGDGIDIWRSTDLNNAIKSAEKVLTYKA